MVANLLPRRRGTLTNESSMTLSIKSRIERQKRMIRLSALRLQCNLERVKQRVLPEPHRSRVVSPFLDLPHKLRNMIFAHYIALVVPPQIHVNSARTNSLTSVPGPLPSLCYTNRKIHAECTALLFLNTELVLPNIISVQRLTHYLRPRPHTLLIPPIHTLVFSPKISWRPHLTHTTKALLAACPSLRHVKICVPHTVCVRTEWALAEEEGFGYIEVPVYRVRTKKEMIDQLDLCCLIDCTALERLTLVCWDGEAVARCLGSRREVVLMPLIGWARKNVCGGGGLRLVVESVG